MSFIKKNQSFPRQRFWRSPPCFFVARHRSICLTLTSALWHSSSSPDDSGRRAEGDRSVPLSRIIPARRNAFHTPACLHPNSTLLFLQHADHERRVPDHICPVFHPDPQYGWTSEPMIPVIVLQTIAANSGSMATPIGESTEPVSLLFLWPSAVVSLWDTCCH